MLLTKWLGKIVSRSGKKSRKVRNFIFRFLVGTLLLAPYIFSYMSLFSLQRKSYTNCSYLFYYYGQEMK